MLTTGIRVLSTLAVLAVVRDGLVAARAAGWMLDVSFDPTARLVARVKEGERADIAVLTDEAARKLAEQGILVEATRQPIARSFIGLAVPAGAPRPRIGTVEELRVALLAAPSIAYSRAGASGIFFAGLLERLGIAGEVNGKATIIAHGLTAELAASGAVSLAVQQVSELMAVPGVDIVGRLPDGANTTAVFSAALFAGAAPRAKAALDWLGGAMTPARLSAAGLEAC